MARRATYGPTEAELEILNILWEAGEATVRDVWIALNEVRDTGYTTPLKILQLMTDKGLVTRDTSRKSHVYKPALTRERAIEQSIGAIVNDYFDGFRAKFLEHMLSSSTVSKRDAESILKGIRKSTRRVANRVSSKHG